MRRLPWHQRQFKISRQVSSMSHLRSISEVYAGISTNIQCKPWRSPNNTKTPQMPNVGWVDTREVIWKAGHKTCTERATDTTLFLSLTSPLISYHTKGESKQVQYYSSSVYPQLRKYPIMLFLIPNYYYIMPIKKMHPSCLFLNTHINNQSASRHPAG